jgi:hypothetical protein
MVEYGAGAVINTVEYGRTYETGEPGETAVAYYDIGVQPNPAKPSAYGLRWKTRASTMSKTLPCAFTAQKDGRTVNIGDAFTSDTLIPGQAKYFYGEFITQGVTDTDGRLFEAGDVGGKWTLNAYLLENDTENIKIKRSTELKINTPPVAMTADIADALAGVPMFFDASKSMIRTAIS